MAAPRLFGTNGIREVVGERFTAPFVARVAAAIASVVPPPGPIAVGWDGRTSSPAAARIVSAALALAGHHVIELGLLPTPAIQYNVQPVDARFAVIVTASHNPPEFNGIKCIGADGLEVPRDTEEAIEAAVAGDGSGGAPFSGIGEISPDAMGGRRYLDGIVAQVDRAQIARRKFTVVLDCGNGASVPTSPALLRRLGCRGVTLNGHVDGTFPGRASEPTEANLGELCRTVAAVGADLGVAHDGDADRAVFVDATGRFVPGEVMFTLLARDAVERNRGGVVVTPVSGSQAVEDTIGPIGGRVVYTRVGSPSVVREMRSSGAVFGGEENGGMVFPSFQLARDGAMALATVLDLLARRGSDLSDALRDIPRYTLLREKVACPIALREPVIARVTESFRAASDRLVTLDGVKAYLDGGWILLRPSGTEPIFRIFAESKDAARARALADRGIEVVRRALRELGDSGRPDRPPIRGEPPPITGRTVRGPATRTRATGKRRR
jgi:phosphomannomutase / phosphoglucomutase